MSEDNATQIMDMYDKDDLQARSRNFIARMEHKLYAKEHNIGRYRR